MKEGHPTLDRGLVYRCMLVGFDDASAKACGVAVSPLVATRMGNAAEACAKIAELHPLIVLVPDGTPVAQSTELRELASACGAEVIAVALPVDGSTLGRRILDALRTSEARRVPR